MSEALRQLKDKASSAYADGRLKEALHAYESLVDRDPSDLNSRLKIGDLHRRLGDRRSAIVAYESVARAYAEDGQLLKAIAVCKVILTVDSRHTSTQERLADLYSKRRQPAGPTSGGLGTAPSSTSTFVRMTAERSEPGEAPRMSPPTSGGHPSIPTAPTTSSDRILRTAGVEPAARPPGRRAPPPSAQTWAGQISLEELKKIRMDAQGRPVSDEPAPPPPPPPGPSPHDGEGRGLPHIPLFSDLPRPAFVELLVKMKMREVPPGQIILKEGQPGESFFVVAGGQVRVSRRNDAGQEVLLARLREGAFFGEMAILQPGPRTATVTAELESQVLEISRTVLDEVIRRYPTVATALRNFQRQRLLATCMATHELFQPFTLEDRRRLMQNFKSKFFDRGSVLLHQGHPASGLYILLTGRMVVTKDTDGEAVQLAELQPGAMFGEMSLLSNEPVSATVTAVTDCFILRLSKRNFSEVMMTHPQILELVSQISESRREANQMILGMQISPHAAMLV